MDIKAQVGLWGAGFIGIPSLCGTVVWSYYPSAPFAQILCVGTDQPCSANAVYRTFARFDLSGIEGEVVQALAWFKLVGKTSPNADVELLEINDFEQLDAADWSKATEGNQRATVGTIITTGTAVGWVSIDVTERLLVAIDDGLGHFAVALRSLGEGSIGKNRWYALAAPDTGEGPYLEITERTAAAPPSGLGAYILTGPRVGLQWLDTNAGAAQEDGYEIWRKVDAGSYSLLHTTDPDETSYIDTDVVEGSIYTYKMRAHNSTGYSDFCAEAVATREYSGTPLPIALGWCYNIEPLLIDDLTYCYSDPNLAPTTAVDVVRVAGVVQTSGFTVDTVANTVVFDSDPGGQVTLDVRGVTEAGEFLQTAGQVCSWCLRVLGGVDAAKLNAEAFAQYDLDMPYAVGKYLNEQGQLQELLDDIIRGLMTFLGPDGEGEWTARLCGRPTGEAALEITEEMIEEFSVEPLDEPIIWRSTLKCARNYCVNGTLADGVDESFRAWAGLEYRQASAQDAGIKTLYPLAEEDGPHETSLARTVDGDAVAQMRLDKSGGQGLKVSMKVVPLARDVMPSDEVFITYPGWGFESGRLGRVTRVRKTDKPDRILIEAEVWPL